MKVSAIMPTANRRHFIPLALRVWLEQDYKEKELVVVDDGEDSVANIIPDHPSIRYVRLEGHGRTIGEKRNICCEEARGDLIWHLDDDDWSYPGRMAEQVRTMSETGAPLTGYGTMLFWDVDARILRRYVADNPWFVCCTSFCYPRSVGLRFPNPGRKMTGEDNIFLNNMRSHVIQRDGTDAMVARVHNQTSYKKDLDGKAFQPLPLTALPMGVVPRAKTVVLAMISWNTMNATVEAAQEMLRERDRLRALGERVHVAWVDNGSTDGTAEALLRLATQNGVQLFVHNPENRGSSIARNQIIDHALASQADFIMFVDGDIELVPWSSWAMLQYAVASPQVGVIGVWSGNYTTHRSSASRLYDYVRYVKSTDVIAWTQYGMFRVDMFRGGVRFPSSGAFGRPGWGFEDNDMMLQMLRGGWQCRFVSDITYLHRAKHSSHANMIKAGQDPVRAYEERRREFLAKWQGTLEFDRTKHYYKDLKLPDERGT